MSTEIKENDICYIRSSESKLYFEVKVIGKTFSYGRIRYIVEPVAGKGRSVVQKLFKKIDFEPPAKKKVKKEYA